jgi:murein L,D-transpeptidase YafK
LLLAFLLAGIVIYFSGRSIWVPVYLRLIGKQTVADAVSKYGPRAERRLIPFFSAAREKYPPERIALIAIKNEKRLELWASDGATWRAIRSYPILRLSGTIGPKLLEGDHQAPEGTYRIVALNPNSSYHLSMKLSYPNDFDRMMARHDARSNLGGDIFIHGNKVSVGCLAMGDEAIEDLFVLVSKVGQQECTVLIAPQDLRKNSAVQGENLPLWSGDLYRSLAEQMEKYR